MSIDIKIDVQSLSTEITGLLDRNYINSIAKQTGFSLQEAKIDGFVFLDMLLFTHFNHKELSLNDLSVQIKKRFDIDISRQSIDERFTSRAVEFFRTVLERALKITISKHYKVNFLTYDRVLIKDATSFQLSENMVDSYKGSGGSGSISAIKIQFEYDLISGKIIDLSLFSFIVQDATNAADTIDNIRNNELIIRDLGYISIPVLRAIQEKEAFFVNRTQTSVNVYELKNDKFVEIDFVKLHKSMELSGLTIIEKEVYIGKKEQFKTKMIVETLPEKYYNQRIRKAEEKAKKKGRTLTDKYKAKQAMNIYITNTDISFKDIRLLYTLRWQIELMFKIWKSIGEINKVKKMKVERFECCLFAKLIWIVLNWKIMRLAVNYFYQQEQLKISPYKFFKTLKSSILDFRESLSSSIKDIYGFIMENIELCPKYHLSEKKKGSKTWSYEIYEMLQTKY
ncbi:MAG: IS4 family transposase [Flavobacteriaceae bacterium]|nr:IS4 family transposase [Flavobacteriaceae bacterium]